ncbi:2-oxo acid dehydrogenase subunit E2 [Microbacterium sp. 4-7]|uniref:2-oxo acid dehydrogenase subunit E2 n=1 Tax=Microbacterium sp. 4-7 TaxID=1885327 RepID=UPI00165088F9|nr:2-oxo acid dehydrogenase subunit E2 [Microbacterium sp. 4-7]MBC6496674.1 hypothetical protein [Microbacterium sp. 4-7]
MGQAVHVPALGESVTEGTVTRWLKAVGERVELDESLVEISTDKVDTEIPSSVAGVVEEILVLEEATVHVGDALALIGDGRSTRSEELNAHAATAPMPDQGVHGALQENTTDASAAPIEPVAATTATSCPDLGSSVAASETPRKRERGGDLASATHEDGGDHGLGRNVSPLRGTTMRMTRLRKVIADRALTSMTSMAQVTTVVEVDVTRIARLRDRVKTEFHGKTGRKLSFLSFFAMASAEALRVHPIINSTVDGDSIVHHDEENLSIAVDTERGLLAPVIRDSAQLDIAGLTARIADLAERTRSNQLKPDELTGGTFTLTNTGSRGALFDTPVVFLPQAAILGTGTVVKRPVVVSAANADAIAVRSMVYLALSYDHRIIDGADAARFLATVKARLEEGAFETDLGI